MEQQICFGFLGNGITVWTECGIGKSNPDFQAHISPTREITYYQENTPQYFRDAVEKQAQDNMIVGNEHDYFALIPKNKPTKYCDTRYCGRILICVEVCDGKEHLCTTKGQIVDDWKANIVDINPDDDRPIYIVGNVKRDHYNNLVGEKFGFSYSKEDAEKAANAIRNWKSPVWRNAVVMECTHDELCWASVFYSLVNLDWED